LPFIGLHSNFKKKLEHFKFLPINQLLQKVLAVERQRYAMLENLISQMVKDIEI